jgi:hypothetical protein
MNIYKTIGQLVVVILICILVNHIMAPKAVEDPFKFADQERLDRMETRLDSIISSTHSAKSSQSMKPKSSVYVRTAVLAMTSSVACLAMSSQAYCQPATKTQRDSLVLIPKQLVVYMLQDLVQADSDRVELQLSAEQVALQNDLIAKQTEMVNILQKRITILTETYNTCTTDRDSLFVQYVELTKKHRRLKKSRNFWSSLAGVFGGLFAIKAL